MNSSNKPISAILIYFFLTIVISPLASNGIIIEGDWIHYAVEDSSVAINSFYGAWPPAFFYGNWSVSEGDIIAFEITSIDSVSINGTISLGSTVFVNLRNIDVASALAISIYPWLGGFFVNTSEWASLPIILDGTNTTIDMENNYIQEINGTNLSFNIKRFDTNNYYGQNSTLIYDFKTGVLLYAFTSFMDYYLEISLVATNIRLDSEYTTSILNPPVIMTIILFFGLLVIRRAASKRYNKTDA